MIARITAKALSKRAVDAAKCINRAIKMFGDEIEAQGIDTRGDGKKIVSFTLDQLVGLSTQMGQVRDELRKFAK